MLTGGLGLLGATFRAHRTGQLSPSPLSRLPVLPLMEGEERRIVGNREMARRAINLSDELCYLGRGQRPDLSSCLETQFMVLTKFKIYLEQKRRVNGTEFSTLSTPSRPHLFCELFLKHQSANRYVQRTC